MPSARKQATPVQPIAAPADGWLSVVQTGRALGVAPATVYALTVYGHFKKTQLVNGRLFVHRESIEEYQARRASEPQTVAVG